MDDLVGKELHAKLSQYSTDALKGEIERCRTKMKETKVDEAVNRLADRIFVMEEIISDRERRKQVFLERGANHYEW